MSEKEFERFDLVEARELRFKDHEVFLSFWDDDHALEFREWLEVEGWKQFQTYIDKQQEPHEKA